MPKFEEEFNYLIELSGKVLIGQVDAEAFEKNRIAFFEKYETDQQQALPVVPECVAEWYEEHKDDLESSIYRLCIEFSQKVVNTLKTKTKLENWFDYTENKPIETLIRMLDGYRVEKPQLFYLKNKLTGKYLRKSKHTKDDWNEDIDRVETVNNKTKFTQQEIDSMETGSYEQIEVVE
ncbi:DUF1642 domain-containing protein [Lactococcus cremoris]|uniref:DUF1642 domain-containing protein n=1 Tax=Lactococcus lactis subsp. cremoris TaxID=1359 RepID=UPI002872A10E|nr:DUF1642 domain-containing protein [Lactococcus cremoris]MDR9868370.1 DUF1642 domain-containing protein [Lactococcus cremoris]